MSGRRTGVILISALGLLISSAALRPAHAITPPKFVTEERYASIVVDGDTGRVLAARNADHTLAPASLTKIMTLYMAFDALKRGQLQLTKVLPVSAHAASMTPTELGLRTGETLTAEQAILGLVTRSANDAAVVLAEALGGTEAEFAKKMTERAFQLGMDQSNFANASGLPNPRQVSSARDMALLAMAMLRDHRAEYRYFSTFKFTYRGRAYYNHNRLLGLYKGTDGVKTGYTNDSGYNLVASALRDGRRVIGVVFGGSSGRARDAHMITLLDDGFRSLGPRPSKPADPDEILEASAKEPLKLAATAAFDFKPVEVLKPTEVRVAAAAPAQTAKKAEESPRPSSKGQVVQIRTTTPSRG
jgi:D-alanyl-D-alanine carboxypeptidase